MRAANAPYKGQDQGYALRQARCLHVHLCALCTSRSACARPTYADLQLSLALPVRVAASSSLSTLLTHRPALVYTRDRHSVQPNNLLSGCAGTRRPCSSRAPFRPPPTPPQHASSCSCWPSPHHAYRTPNARRPNRAHLARRLVARRDSDRRPTRHIPRRDLASKKPQALLRHPLLQH